MLINYMCRASIRADTKVKKYSPPTPYPSGPNTLTFNFTDPERNAAYLPRPAFGPPNALHPAFGYVPVNYVAPDSHPFHYAGRFNVPEKSSPLVPHATDMVGGGGINGFDDQVRFACGRLFLQCRPTALTKVFFSENM